MRLLCLLAVAGVAECRLGLKPTDRLPSHDGSVTRNPSHDGSGDGDSPKTHDPMNGPMTMQQDLKAQQERADLQLEDNHRRVFGDDRQKRPSRDVHPWKSPDLSVEDKKKLAARGHEHTMTIFVCQIMTVFTLVLFSTRPQWFWMLQLLVFPAIMASKYPRYRPLKYHLFFYDFCYWMNAWFMVVLVADHCFGWSDCRVLKTMYWSALGPIAHALWLWRNSLVMHDQDKVTSTALHIFPMLTTVAEKFHGASYTECAQTGFWPKDFIHGWMFYMAWQVLYTIIMDGLLRRKIKKDKELMNSIRWLLKDQNGFAFNTIAKVGSKMGISGITGDNKRGKFTFAVCFAIYVFLCTLPMPLLWWYESLTHAMAGLLFSIVVYNGATYSTKIYRDNGIWKGLELDVDKQAADEALPRSRSVSSDQSRISSVDDPPFYFEGDPPFGVVEHQNFGLRHSQSDDYAEEDGEFSPSNVSMEQATAQQATRLLRADRAADPGDDPNGVPFAPRNLHSGRFHNDKDNSYAEGGVRQRRGSQTAHVEYKWSAGLGPRQVHGQPPPPVHRDGEVPVQASCSGKKDCTIS